MNENYLELPGFETIVPMQIYVKKSTIPNINEVMLPSTYIKPSLREIYLYMQNETSIHLDRNKEKRLLGLPLNYLEKALMKFPTQILKPISLGDFSTLNPLLEGLDDIDIGKKFLSVKYIMLPSKYVEKIKTMPFDNIYPDILFDVNNDEISMGFNMEIPLANGSLPPKLTLKELNGYGDSNISQNLLDIIYRAFDSKAKIDFLNDSTQNVLMNACINCLNILRQSLESGLTTYHHFKPSKEIEKRVIIH
jgi:hypothetical protein